MIHDQLDNVTASDHTKHLHNFVEHFVQEIIKEAVKRSSYIVCHNRCSKSSTQFETIDAKNLDLLSRSTTLHFMPNTSVAVSNRNKETKFAYSEKHNSTSEELYTLPINAVGRGKSKKTISLNHQCLKPKAIRAFNVIKSSPHSRSLCDLKYILVKFYSSKRLPSKNIGSEHSAFTQYQCRKSNKRLGSSHLELKRNSARMEHQRAGIMKTGSSDLRRWKRCDFFDFKNSVCGVFKSHKKLSEDSPLDESSFKSFKDRSLPPLPGSYENFSSMAGSSGKNYNDKNSAYNADVQFTYGNYEVGCVKKARAFDFASSIEKVKDCGWYWGPMSSESAEKLLANEKDGSFIVRDSSDNRYIFSLTFKLNSSIMHVRIEHGQGTFSFGNYTNFKSHTIVEFIENTVEHSKSGRYLFFQYRHPVEGPMEVQLLYPVSRFKRVQSLQHMCRFVILKSVRRDLISSLPLPKPLIEYLNSKDYYAEEKF